jgi:hypothetical protein
MSKKNRKSHLPGPAPVPGAAPPGGDAAAPGRKPRRTAWIVAGGIAAALAGLVGIAATLPGLENPNRDLNECYQRLGLVSTALLRWSRAHGDAFPSSLEDLRAAGLLVQDPAFGQCPATGRPFEYQPGLRPDMPGSTVLVSCPEGASHAEIYPGAHPGRVALLVGTDLRIRGEHAPGSGSGEADGAAVRARLSSRLGAQHLVLGLLDRHRGGDPSARAGLEGLLPQGASGALAAWAMGASGDRAFVTALAAALRRARGPGGGTGAGADEYGLSVARALLRLGDRSAAPYLIEAMDSPAGPLREQARAALEEAFRGADPPLPTLRSYVAAGDVPGESEALQRWWTEFRNRGR